MHLQTLIPFLAVFAVIVLITLTLTAPAQTASVRLAGYLPNRPGSPGTYAYSRGMRERLLSPAGRSVGPTTDTRRKR